MPPFAFRKSSYSTPDHECVEVATNVPATTAVRDSKNPGGAILRFPSRSWHAFQSGLKR
jgi:uncharacterized protein DUF397